MATKAPAKAVTDEITEYRWTKAQQRRFNEWQGEVAQARRDLNRAEEAAQKFVNYLAEEHDVDTAQQWVVGPRGFVLAPEPPANGKGENAQGDKGNGNNGDDNTSGEAGEQATPTESVEQDKV